MRAWNHLLSQPFYLLSPLSFMVYAKQTQELIITPTRWHFGSLRPIKVWPSISKESKTGTASFSLSCFFLALTLRRKSHYWIMLQNPFEQAGQRSCWIQRTTAVPDPSGSGHQTPNELSVISLHYRPGLPRGWRSAAASDQVQFHKGTRFVWKTEALFSQGKWSFLTRYNSARMGGISWE